jgi:hypothetical protein
MNSDRLESIISTLSPKRYYSLPAERIPNLTNRKDAKDEKKEENKIGNLRPGRE